MHLKRRSTRVTSAARERYLLACRGLLASHESQLVRLPRRDHPLRSNVTIARG